MSGAGLLASCLLKQLDVAPHVAGVIKLVVGTMAKCIVDDDWQPLELLRNFSI